MPDFELVPFEEADPVSSSARLYELLQDGLTRQQIARYMPHLLETYGQSLPASQSRYREMADLSRDDPDFRAYLHMLGGEPIGSATIDRRFSPYHRKLVRGLYLGKVAVDGPSTSAWIAAPYQGQGIGRESLQQRIDIAVVDLSEPGVWVKVKNSNLPSKNNVLGRGFEKVDDGPVWLAGEHNPDTSVYQYRSS